MKKTIFFLGAFFSFLTLQAQFTAETHDGVPIEDGDIFTYGETGQPAKLAYFVHNNTSSTIYIRAQFVSVENADGSMFQLCITPTCYYEIFVGESYPQEAGAMSVPIPAGEQTGYGNYFMNLAQGNGSDVLEYVFRIYQVDEDGNEVGNSITFTYQYDPLMAIEEMEKIAIAVYPTLVRDLLTIETEEILDMEVYTLQGRLVKSKALPVGETQIAMADLASQMYLIRFKNELGQVKTTKIIVE